MNLEWKTLGVLFLLCLSAFNYSPTFNLWHVLGTIVLIWPFGHAFSSDMNINDLWPWPSDAKWLWPGAWTFTNHIDILFLFAFNVSLVSLTEPCLHWLSFVWWKFWTWVWVYFVCSFVVFPVRNCKINIKHNRNNNMIAWDCGLDHDAFVFAYFFTH